MFFDSQSDFQCVFFVVVCQWYPSHTAPVYTQPSALHLMLVTLLCLSIKAKTQKAQIHIGHILLRVFIVVLHVFVQRRMSPPKKCVTQK